MKDRLRCLPNRRGREQVAAATKEDVAPPRPEPGSAGGDSRTGKVRVLVHRLDVCPLGLKAGAILADCRGNGELFYTLREAQVIIESWRRHYNTVRPHSALGYRPPAPETRHFRLIEQAA